MSVSPTRIGVMMKLLVFGLRLLARLFFIFPVKERVVFMSRQSSKTSLDMRLLINALNRDLSDLEIVTCLTEPETNNALSFIAGTMRQLYYFCTSTVVVVDGYVPAVSIPKKRRATTVIQLWHALGAIKKFGYQCLDTPAGRTSKAAKTACMHKNYDYIIAGGPGAIPAYSEAFGYPEKSILPLGLPRIDYLLDPNPDSERRQIGKTLKDQYDFLHNSKPNILYAPTLRKGDEYKGWLTKALREIAQKYSNKVNLLIAGHPLDFDFDINLLQEFSWLHFIPSVSTIDLLELADTVISDYSAVIFEAGLLGKRLEFFTPDIEKYRESPGLNIEPRDINETFLKNYFAETGYGVTRKICELIKKKI